MEIKYSIRYWKRTVSFSWLMILFVALLLLLGSNKNSEASNSFELSMSEAITTCSSTLICPSNISEYTNAVNCSALVTYNLPSIQSNCSSSTLIRSFGAASGSQFSGITNEIIYTLTDQSGTISSCSFNIGVVDITSPSLTCPPDATIDNDPGACSALVTFEEPLYSDNCPNALLSYNFSFGNPHVFHVGSYQLGFTVVDQAGNQATCMYNITIEDVEPAEVICPADISINAPTNQCFAQVTYILITTNDNCGINNIYLIQGLPSGSIFPVGNTPVCYETQDASLNNASCCFNIEVKDARTIQVNCPAPPVVQSFPGSCTAIVTYSIPTLSQSCYGSTISHLSGPRSGEILPVGTNSICYIVEATSGTSIECCFTVVVDDEENPSITCPPSITTKTFPLACGAIVSYGVPTVFDNCSQASYSLIQGIASGASFGIGNHVLVYLASDSYGNTKSCQFGIEILDDESPQISCPGNYIFPCDLENCSAIVSYEIPQSSDNCNVPSLTLTLGLPSGSTFPLGLTQVCYESKDGNGNSANCCFLVLIMDQEAPNISCPADITEQTDATACQKQTVFIPLPNTADNCNVSLTRNSHTQLEDANGIYPYGLTIVEYVVFDDALNSAACIFQVQVDDGTAPSMTCPENNTIPNIPRSCLGQISYQVQCLDNCDASVVPQRTSGPQNLSVLSLGSYMVEYAATDVSGNRSTCSFSVEIEDMESPEVLNCPADMTIQADSTVNPCGRVVTWQAPLSFDFCGTVTMQSNYSSGNFLEGGSRRYVDYTFTDSNGNTSECRFNAYVIQCNYVPLPVEWISLTGQIVGSTNLLAWQVLGEKELDRYEVLRSEDGIEFMSISEISILGTKGEFYNFTDNTPLTESIYKIVAIDNSGSESYSNTINLERRSNDVFIAIPNPTKGLVALEFYADVIGSYELQIYNATGSLVYTGRGASAASRATVSVDLRSFANGIYLARLRMNGQVKTLRILKD